MIRRLILIQLVCIETVLERTLTHCFRGELIAPTPVGSSDVSV